MGSIKSNIGHLETASGVAGLIRVILMMQHGIIPPQRNFQKLNPHIKLDKSSLRITTEPLEWTGLADHRRLAGVSGFGFGGRMPTSLLRPIARQNRFSRKLLNPSSVRCISSLFSCSQRSSCEYASRLVDRIDSDSTVHVADLDFPLRRRGPHLISVSWPKRGVQRNFEIAWRHLSSTDAAGVVNGPIRVPRSRRSRFSLPDRARNIRAWPRNFIRPSRHSQKIATSAMPSFAPTSNILCLRSCSIPTRPI